MRIIYIDALFFLNLTANYLLLLAAARVGAVFVSRWRIALGALFGAIYAVLAFFPQFSFLLAAPMRIVSGLGMVLLVFGSKRGLLRLSLLFFAISVGFGGLIFAIALFSGSGLPHGPLFLPINLKILLISFALCYFAFSLVFSRLGRDTGGRILQIELTRRGRTIRCAGLSDTGHSLTDPLSGAAVLVVETETALPLFSSDAVPIFTGPLARSPVELLEALSHTPDSGSLYLIPYTAVGVESGFLLAFRPDFLRIDQKEKHGVSVALSPTRVSDGGRYTALVNGGILS